MGIDCAALVLAAGRASRFGGGKMLALINGRPMLQHVLDAAATAELDPVVVVLGADAAAIEQAITWRGERRIVNPDPDRGLSSSLLAGLRELADSDRVIVLLGDQPFVSAANIRTLARQPRDASRPIVVPRYEGGQPGNPVLLERGAFPVAAELTGDRGMSQLFAAHPDLVRHVEVPGRNPDIDTRTDIVAAGYDSLGSSYEEWRSQIDDPTRDRLLAELIDRLRPGSRVLELGCGPGSAESQRIAAKFEFTGVDVSAVQIQTARTRMPESHFLVADMTSLELPDGTFEGVVALYSLIHVPGSQQPALLARIRDWLTPGGVLLATFSATGGGDWTGDWLGVPMFFSGFDSIQNRQMLTDAGFLVETDEIAHVQEPEGPAQFQWIVATATPA